MRIGAIVAEFNPFHNGHAALVHAARTAGADYVIAVMSGSYVQRGETAIADKLVRTQCALAGGVDLILELPLPWATATAQRFAQGAVMLLRATGIVDMLAFGSESGDAVALDALARAVDSPAVRAAMPAYLAEGMTFAKARQQAVSQICGSNMAQLLATPNNALAVEYLRQAQQLDWQPELFTIARRGVAHDEATPQQTYASASYLRADATNFELLASYMPLRSLEVLRAAHIDQLYPANFSQLDIAVLAHLRRLDRVCLGRLPDLSEGLENRFYTSVRSAGNLDALYETLKTKRYTMARLRRLTLAAFLGISRTDLETAPPYLRVLGYRQHAKELMGLIGRTATLPVGSSLMPLSQRSAACARVAALEETAGDLYGLALPKAYPCGFELRAKIVVVPAPA